MGLWGKGCQWCFSQWGHILGTEVLSAFRSAGKAVCILIGHKCRMDFDLLLCVTRCDKKYRCHMLARPCMATSRFLWHWSPLLYVLSSTLSLPEVSGLLLSRSSIFELFCYRPTFVEYCWSVISKSNCTAQREKFNIAKWPCAPRPSIGVILWPPYASIGL